MSQRIPSNITIEDVNKAVKEITASQIPERRHATKYVMLINQHRLPPKYVISIANRYANGEELNSTAFNAVQAKNFLRKLGFTIERIEAKKSNKSGEAEEVIKSFYTPLLQFIRQADTTDLKTKGYPSTFAGLKVKISFGAGNKAKIPWIAFLNKTDKVQNGIYPVYLYYTKLHLLILAYGVSETNIPNRTWQLDKPESIATYFETHNLGEPPRYGDSYVYKVYNLREPLHKSEVDRDLLTLIHYYNQTDALLMPRSQNNNSSAVATPPFSLSAFLIALQNSGLTLSPTLVKRLVASLLTKPFVILTGLSGSGKTKLAQSFAQWLCKDKQQYCLVPVGADWTNREALLGYPNSLNSNEYIRPDNGTLDLIIAANEKPHLPFFLILDEMNLSHVERYFADFLSIMESKESISLYTTSNQKKSGVPSLLCWPANLFVIGTVNIDETTNMFSPKVLDRANTIEFRVTYKEMNDFLSKVRSLDMKKLEAKGAAMATSFLALSADKLLSTQEIEPIHKTLLNFFQELRKLGAEYGYRSATEILQLLHQLGVIDSLLPLNSKLDIAIIQKILPKLHGSRRKLCPVLATLGRLCLKSKINSIEKEVFEREDYDYDQAQVLYPLSLEKISRMYKGAVENGFTSFAEA